MKGARGCEGRQRCEVWGDDGGERERVLWAQTQEDDALASQESSTHPGENKTSQVLAGPRPLPPQFKACQDKLRAIFSDLTRALHFKSYSQS